jgi:hypothetical protein
MFFLAREDRDREDVSIRSDDELLNIRSCNWYPLILICKDRVKLSARLRASYTHHPSYSKLDRASAK